MSFDVDLDEFVELQKKNRRLREQLESLRRAAEYAHQETHSHPIGSMPEVCPPCAVFVPEINPLDNEDTMWESGDAMAAGATCQTCGGARYIERSWLEHASDDPCPDCNASSGNSPDGTSRMGSGLIAGADDGTDSGTPDDGSAERLSRPATSSSEASDPAISPESD